MIERASVSVIVAIFNAEKTLKRALLSITSQTLKNLQIILVDDGSTDSSGKICDELADEDKRVFVIHKKNGGVSSARQAGLDVATGKYTIHIDSDDWIESDMFEGLYNRAEQESAEIIICDYIIEDCNSSKIFSHNLNSCLSSKTTLQMLLSGELGGFCCNKLIRTDLCKSVKFYPPSIKFREDELYIARILTNDVKVCFYQKAYYHYIMNANSLSHAPLDKTYNDITYLIAQYQEIVKSNNLPEEILFKRKREVLSNAFVLRKFNDLHKFPEIHQDLIKEGRPYRWKRSRLFFLSLALKGYPHIASLLYRINANIITAFMSLSNKSAK